MMQANHTYYTKKTENPMNSNINSDPIDISWNEAQEWCNFVLFRPTWLPDGLIEISNKIRPESPEEESSHRSEFSDGSRSLSIKQFLYDWAPPAYDHPCLWRNAKISTIENTPIPNANLIGNNYLWFGLDYRRKSAATINMLRTQIEITTLHGAFDDQEITQIVSAMVPADNNTKDLILSTNFAELMYNHRHEAPASDVPTSYFKHIRDKSFRCYPFTASSLDIKTSLPGYWLKHVTIQDYKLNSIFLFGRDLQNIQEAEYYFESFIEPGSYVRFLVTHKDAEYSIQYPPLLGDQACHNAIHNLKNGESLHHAWSATNENGCHSLIFQTKNETINCIIKPARWTTAYWAVELCQNALIQFKTIEWAMTALQQTKLNTETVVQTPWSSVIRIKTGDELFYLKTTPALIALESKIIQLLHDQFLAPVPTVIAHNSELHCFLMKDAGTSLRSILKKEFDTDLLCKAIEKFTALQITVADHVDDFINIGVPDWRLNKLPDLYRQAILQKDLLMDDGLSESEINELEELLSKITDLCERLSRYAIKETIVQPDFNDNNTLIDDQSKAITIIDLGEISISHPFFSLLNCLHVIKKYHALTNEDAAYLKAKDACLKNYRQFESEKNVADALEIAHVLWFVYGLLAHDRLMQACGREQLMSFQHGKLSEMLKELIAVCKSY